MESDRVYGMVAVGKPLRRAVSISRFGSVHFVAVVFTAISKVVKL